MKPPVLDALLTRLLPSNRKAAAAWNVYAQLELADSPAAVRRLVTANLRFTLAYYARYFALPSALLRERMRRTVRPNQRESLRCAMADGRGAIALAVHLGDFDLAGYWLATELEREVVVVSPTIRPDWREALYRQIRLSAGFRVRRQERTTLDDLVRDLGQGRLVLFLADRRASGRQVSIEFLGRPSTLSAAPAWLSAQTGAAILTAATYTERHERPLLFGAPRWAERPTDYRWAAPAVAELEAIIRRVPHQWHIPADISQMPLALGRRASKAPSTGL